jgi:hypothetical protein
VEKVQSARLETAHKLAKSHYRVEPELKHIFLLTSDHEDDPKEPIKLLEVLDSTLADEIMPISFSADPARGIDYPCSIIEMSTREFDARKTRTIQFRGRRWKIGDDLLAANAVR